MSSEINIHWDPSGSYINSPQFIYVHRNLRSFQIKLALFEFLEHYSSKLATFYHTMIFLLTMIVFVLAFVAILPNSNNSLQIPYFTCEFVLLFIYSVEFSMRLWACDVHEKYSGKRRIRYVKKFNMTLDIIIVVISLISLIIMIIYENISQWIILIFLFSEVLRFFRFKFIRNSTILLMRVLHMHRASLITGYACAVLIMLFSAFLLTIVEIALKTNQFNRLSDSLYFILISFMTIGYGDYTPQSTSAKIIICATALVGIAFVAVPSGIIGSGFALEVRDKERKKQLEEFKKPAQSLIQRASRFYLFTQKFPPTLLSDYNNTITSKKTKLFILKKFILPDKYEKEKPLTSGKNLPQDSAETVPPSNIFENFDPIFQKKKLKKQRYSISQNIDKTRLQKCLFISGKLIRYLYMKLAAIRFKVIKSPLSVEDSLDSLLLQQKKTLFYILDINDKFQSLDKSEGKIKNLVSSSPRYFNRSSSDIYMNEREILDRFSSEVFRLELQIKSTREEMQEIVQMMKNIERKLDSLNLT